MCWKLGWNQSLNPFEFRAGIYCGRRGGCHCTCVLIPLNSGLVFTDDPKFGWKLAVVLIPLNSGLVFTDSERQSRGVLQVLIPLNSGLVFTVTVCRMGKYIKRLNPFEFRAGIYCQG